MRWLAANGNHKFGGGFRFFSFLILLETPRTAKRRIINNATQGRRNGISSLVGSPSNEAPAAVAATIVTMLE